MLIFTELQAVVEGERTAVWVEEPGLWWHDGHFDFTNASTPVSGDGKEQTADTDGQDGGGNQNILSAQ